MLGAAPVVIVLPVVDYLLHVSQGYALAPIGWGFLFRQAGEGQALL